MLLKAADYKHYVDDFNSMEPEDIVNLVPNSRAWEWMTENIPLFTCPDSELEKIYYYRWWTYRKHIKRTPVGRVLTEFISNVSHAGSYNAISCALGHHIAEGRWLRDQTMLDEYIRFWFRGDNGKPERTFHKYSQWAASAMWDRHLVTGDAAQLLDLLDDLIADYKLWEDEKLLPNGLFWQFDVRDGMEESISGSRRHRNFRPTINSYMYANAIAIADIAEMARRPDVVQTFRDRAAKLKKLVHERMWEESSRFFKAQTQENGLCSAREAIGFIPWCFNLPEAGLEDAWKQLIDPQGFWAPFGITTAERRHPQFRSHGVGKCEWDGAVWPFATSQTLGALANVLRHYKQSFVSKEHYLEAMQAYVKSTHRKGKPYIGEYLDETNGEWLKFDNPRSRWYNHSTFCDLVISGLAGIVPRRDSTVEVHPLLPAKAWDFFALDAVPYHGKTLTIVWDRDGSRFGRGAGLTIFSNDQPIAHSPQLAPLTGSL